MVFVCPNGYTHKIIMISENPRSNKLWIIYALAVEFNKKVLHHRTILSKVQFGSQILLSFSVDFVFTKVSLVQFRIIVRVDYYNKRFFNLVVKHKSIVISPNTRIYILYQVTTNKKI